MTWRPDGSALIKVLDFGISKSPIGTEMQLTQTQSLLGTPAYMSPEQMRSARLVDARTDIWSLGTVLYEVLEGRRPFEAESFSEMCVKVAVDPPRPMTHTPPALQQVVLRCLAKDARAALRDDGASSRAIWSGSPHDPHQAQMLVERMEHVTRRSLHTMDAVAPPPSTRRKRRWPMVALPLIAIAIGTTLGLWVGGSGDDAPSPVSAAPTAAIAAPPPAAGATAPCAGARDRRRSDRAGRGPRGPQGRQASDPTARPSPGGEAAEAGAVQGVRAYGRLLSRMRHAFVLLCAVAMPVAADPGDDRARAVELFDDGRRLMLAGDAAGACAKFDEAIQIEPLAAGTMLNLGLCNEALGKYKTALDWFRKAQVRATETDPPLPAAEREAREHATLLVGRVATIRIVAPGGASVSIDGEPVRRGDLARVEIDPGHHVLEATAPGKPAIHRELDVSGSGGDTVTLAFDADTGRARARPQRGRAVHRPRRRRAARDEPWPHAVREARLFRPRGRRAGGRPHRARRDPRRDEHRAHVRHRARRPRDPRGRRRRLPDHHRPRPHRRGAGDRAGRCRRRGRGAVLMRAIALVALTGCNVVFGFDDIHPDAPRTTASPGPHPFAGANTFFYVRPVAITLASDGPGTTMFYTTDGSTPTAASQSGLAPVTLTLEDGPTTLSYFGTNAGGSDGAHTDVYHFDATQTIQTGYVVTDTALANGSPIAVVAPGGTVDGTAHVQIWSQSDCPSCALQLVYGVDATDQGCLFDTARDAADGPGVFPGVEHDAAFTVTAPTAPGVYEIRVANNEQFTCDEAVAKNSLQSRPDVARIGVLVVQ